MRSILRLGSTLCGFALAAAVLAQQNGDKGSAESTTDAIGKAFLALNLTSWAIVIVCAILFGGAIGFLIFKAALSKSGPASASHKGVLAWAILTPLFIILVPVFVMVRDRATGYRENAPTSHSSDHDSGAQGNSESATNGGNF